MQWYLGEKHVLTFYICIPCTKVSFSLSLLWHTTVLQMIAFTAVAPVTLHLLGMSDRCLPDVPVMPWNAIDYSETTHLSWKWCFRNSSREKVNSFFMTPQLLWLYHLLANICLYWMPPSGDTWSMCTPWHSSFVFTVLSYLLLELQEGSEIYSLDSILQIILCLLDDRNVWNYFWKAAFSWETLVACLLQKNQHWQTFCFSTP